MFGTWAKDFGLGRSLFHRKVTVSYLIKSATAQLQLQLSKRVVRGTSRAIVDKRGTLDHFLTLKKDH